MIADAPLLFEDYTGFFDDMDAREIFLKFRSIMMAKRLQEVLKITVWTKNITIVEKGEVERITA